MNYYKAFMFVLIYEATQWELDKKSQIILTSDNTWYPASING